MVFHCANDCSEVEVDGEEGNEDKMEEASTALGLSVNKAAATFLPSIFNTLNVAAALTVFEASTIIPFVRKKLTMSGEIGFGIVSPHPINNTSMVGYMSGNRASDSNVISSNLFTFFHMRNVLGRHRTQFRTKVSFT